MQNELGSGGGVFKFNLFCLISFIAADATADYDDEDDDDYDGQ